MLRANDIDYQQVARVAREGSPLLLQAVGRLFGLGSSERAAFAGNGAVLPGWFWATLFLSVGFVAGVRVHSQWPSKVPKLISGEK